MTKNRSTGPLAGAERTLQADEPARFAPPYIVVAAIVLVCLAPPLALLATGGDLQTTLAFFGEPRQIELFERSLGVAAAATVLALVWGIPTGLVIARARGPLGTAVEILSYIPLLLPSIIVVLGWIYMLGRAGALTRVLTRLFGLEGPPVDIYTPLGAGFVLSLCYFPVVSILCAQGFRSASAEELRAAELAAGAAGRFWHFWRPLMAPYLATATLIVFLMSFADYGVPSALTINVFPVEIFVQLSTHLDVERAAALGALPGALAALLVLLRHLAVRSAPSPASGLGARPGGRIPRPALFLALLAILLGSLVPLLFLAITAGPLDSYARALRTAGAQVLESLSVGGWSMALLVLLGGAFAAAHRALGRRGKIAAETLILLPLVIPGAAVGLGVLFLVDEGIPPFSWLYPHPALLAYACACRYAVFPCLLLAGAAASIRPELLRSAAASGARPLSVVSRIALPLILPAVVAAAALSFILSFGELSASVLVHPPGGMTLPVRLSSLLHFGEDAIVAALCLMASGFLIGVLLLAHLVIHRPLRIELCHES